MHLIKTLFFWGGGVSVLIVLVMDLFSECENTTASSQLDREGGGAGAPPVTIDLLQHFLFLHQLETNNSQVQ